MKIFEASENLLSTWERFENIFQDGETGSKKKSTSKSDLAKSKRDISVDNESGNEPEDEDDSEEEEEEEATMPVELQWGESEETENPRKLKIGKDHGSSFFPILQRKISEWIWIQQMSQIQTSPVFWLSKCLKSKLVWI